MQSISYINTTKSSHRNGGRSLYTLGTYDDEGRGFYPSSIVVCAGGRNARLCFIGDDASTSGLVLVRTGIEACRFDAAVLLLVRRTRTGRRRVVVVVDGTGSATVVRLENDQECVTYAPGLSAGGTAGRQLAALWSGLRGDDGR